MKNPIDILSTFVDEDEGDISLEKELDLDVTALDRYNADVRKYRHALLEECKLVHKQYVDLIYS